MLDQELTREARAYVEQMGAETSKTNVEHMKALLRAFEKFVERNETYDDLWKQETEAENASQFRHKALRVYGILTGPKRLTTAKEEIIDNAIDGINYAVFVIRKLKEKERQDG